MSVPDPFTAFVRDMKEMIDLSEVQVRDADLDCIICTNEFEIEGERRPKFLSCCKQNLCAVCENKIRVDAVEKKKDEKDYVAACPFCRVPLETEDDEKCIQKLKEQVKKDVSKGVTEKEGIKCINCDKIAFKPHHRFVCLTCRDRTGEWLLSCLEPDRIKIREGTMCMLCSYRHSLYHMNRKNEKNETRPLSQLFGYSRAQVEIASDALTNRIKEKGILPQSMCIVFSMWKDVMRGCRFEKSTIDRLIEIQKINKESLCNHTVKMLAQADFVQSFPTVAKDVEWWCQEILNAREYTKEHFAWAAAASQLMLTSIELVNDIYPEYIEDLWIDYLDDLILKWLPSVVRKSPLEDSDRLLTITRLYNTCRMIDLSWEDLAYGRLLKREMVLIRNRPDKEKTDPVVQKRLDTIYGIYTKKCEDHENWRAEKLAKA